MLLSLSRITATVISVALGLVLVGCTTTPTASPDGPGTPTPPDGVATSTPPPAGATATPFPTQRVTAVLGDAFINANHITYVVLPRALGYWEEEGLDVQVELAAGGGQRLALLEAGQAHFGFFPAVQTIVSRSEGIEVKAVYNLLRQHATAIAVPADSDVQSPEDLRGATIGIIAEGAARSLDGRAMIQAAGMDPDQDVNWLAVGLGAGALEALRQDQVQALILFDAEYANMENQGQEFRYFTFPFQEGIFSVVWNAMDSFIADNPETIIRFGRAQAKAEVFALANPDAAVRIFLQEHPDLIPSGMTEETAFEHALNILNSNLANMRLEEGEIRGSFPPGSWDTLQDYYIDLGLVEDPVDDTSELHAQRDMIEQMNDFDHDAVRQSAIDWTP